MSIIIAAKTDGYVTMTFDSLEISGGCCRLLEDDERRKVLVIGNVLVGSAGRVSSIRRLVSHPEWFDTHGRPFDKRFIVTQIIPKFYEELDKHELLKTEENEPNGLDASIMLACGDRLFEIDSTFAVNEVDKFCAVGCTKRLIFPLISEMEEGKEREAMRSAVRLSGDLSLSVGPPYYEIDTVNCEYRLIDGGQC